MAEFWTVTFPAAGTTAATAQAAEEAGWDGLFFPDTQCLSGDVYSGCVLAAAATTTLKIGPGVTNPVTRHPAVTASAAATLQVESDGRAVLGMGRGDSALAYIGRPPAPVSLFENYMADVQRHLSGEPVDIDGFESNNRWIADSGQPKVPVDVAATGPRVISAAAVHAERITLAMGADAPRIADAMDLARQARSDAGFDPDELSFGAYVNCTADDDVARARERISGSVGVFAHFSGMKGAPTQGLKDQATFEAVGANYDMPNHARIGAAHTKLMDDEFIDRFAVAGPSAYCVERLGELLDLGLDRLVLITFSGDADPEDVKAGNARLTTEVLPQLR